MNGGIIMKTKQSVMISFVLATAIVMALMTISAQEVHAVKKVETVVDGVKYTLNDDRTAEVSGYTEDLPNTVVIPSSVTYEGADYTVTSIGNAFYNCTVLENITIPAHVTVIKAFAFSNSNLKSITFEAGSKLDIIEYDAFIMCKNLKSITIPANVTYIGESAFDSTGLIDVTFEPGNKIMKLEDGAFNYNGQNKLLIHYIGTEEDWDKIEKGWLNDYIIHYVTNDPGVKPATLDEDGYALYKCSDCDSCYTFAIRKPSSFKLSANKYTYNGKAKKPAITVGDGIRNLTVGTDYDVTYDSGCKNVGSYKVTVNLKGNYSGSKSISFKILPKKASIRSAKPGKKKIKVTMSKKVKSTGGKYYKIQYRVKGTKKWKTKKTSKQALTISKLKKGKRYQIRVCAYKDVKGTRYTGAWSKIKTTGKVK